MPNIGIYVSDTLDQRIRRLKERGADVQVSAVCQKGLEAAVEAEERSLDGDRMARLIARVNRTRTAAEQAEAEGVAAGRQWAEDVAAFSEMTEVRSIRDALASGPEWVERISVDANQVDLLCEYEGRRMNDDARSTFTLPESVPVDFFLDLVPHGRDEKHAHRAALGFIEGACSVLTALEEAMGRKPQIRDVDPDGIPF